jgi:short-subunit dehydrogenase
VPKPHPDRTVVLLTGASVGLGLAIARRLVEHPDLHVVLTARASSLRRFAEARLVPSPRLWLRELDITDEQQRAAVISEIEQRLGGVDVLINNAGIAYRTVTEYATSAELTHQMAVNYEGPMALTALVLPSMRRRRAGRIIQISSAGGLVAMPTMGLYSASKFALEAASEAMHYEVRPFGIQVSLVLPGFVRSPSYKNAIVGLPSRLATEGSQDAYHAHFKHMDRLIERLMHVTRASPESVARRVVQLLRRRRAPLRLLATWDASVLWWFRRFTPQPLYVWITYHLLPGIRQWGRLAPRLERPALAHAEQAQPPRVVTQGAADVLHRVVAATARSGPATSGVQSANRQLKACQRQERPH